MRKALCILALAFVSGCATAPPITLVPEQRTTLHVGDTVVLYIPADRRYSKFQANSFPGLTFVKRAEDRVVYRAVQPGPEVIIISPDVPAGECISCATIHYFVDVISAGPKGPALRDRK